MWVGFASNHTQDNVKYAHSFSGAECIHMDDRKSKLSPIRARGGKMWCKQYLSMYLSIFTYTPLCIKLQRSFGKRRKNNDVIPDIEVWSFFSFVWHLNWLDVRLQGCELATSIAHPCDNDGWWWCWFVSVVVLELIDFNFFWKRVIHTTNIAIINYFWIIYVVNYTTLFSKTIDDFRLQ